RPVHRRRNMAVADLDRAVGERSMHEIGTAVGEAHAAEAALRIEPQLRHARAAGEAQRKAKRQSRAPPREPTPPRHGAIVPRQRPKKQTAAALAAGFRAIAAEGEGRSAEGPDFGRRVAEIST